MAVQRCCFAFGASRRPGRCSRHSPWTTHRELWLKLTHSTFENNFGANSGRYVSCLSLLGVSIYTLNRRVCCEGGTVCRVKVWIRGRCSLSDSVCVLNSKVHSA